MRADEARPARHQYLHAPALRLGAHARESPADRLAAQMPEQDPAALAPAFALAARHQRERRAEEQRERQLDEPHRHHRMRLPCPAVLAEEMVERAVVLDARRQRHDLLGRGAVDVHQLRVRQVHHAPAPAAHLVEPVGLLEEEEVVLGHRSDLLDHLAAHHHAGAQHGFHVERLVVLEALRGIAAREQRLEHAARDDLEQQRREVVDAVLLAAVRVQQLRADRADVRVRVEVAHAALEAVVLHDRVVVEQTQHAALRARESRVVAGGEADVARQRDHFGPREALAHRPRPCRRWSRCPPRSSRSRGARRPCANGSRARSRQGNRARDRARSR